MKPEEWDLVGPRAFVIFPSMALLAGFLGGMLGIGGGMIINPLLIEIGMHPQVCCCDILMHLLSRSIVQLEVFVYSTNLLHIRAS